MSPLSPTLLHCALTLTCPRCGEGKIVQGLLSLAPECPVCRLCLSEYNPTDGPAQLVIWVVGILATVLAAAVELIYAPSYWLHAAIWLPFICLSSIWLLRVFKALMLALEYRHRPEGFER